jgi:hypothetical protein
LPIKVFIYRVSPMPRSPNSSPQTLRVFEALLEKPADWHYGYGLSKQTGLAPGTLYPILGRLVDGTLLETRWEPSSQPGRPQRHLYRLTPDGLATARARLAERKARPATGRLGAGRTAAPGSTAAMPGAVATPGMVAMPGMAT